MYIKHVPSKLTHKLHTSKNYMLPEDGQELRPKHVGAIIIKNIVEQVHMKYYVYIG
jgi:hypothetical protein